MIDLGALAFAPKRVGAHAAHLCVRNNFTTLECATLRGWGVAVEVFAARSARGGKKVHDVAFALPRAGDGYGADVLTQTFHVVNRGSAEVRLGKAYVGPDECGGDGAHSGYRVQPCAPFTLAPGGSKRMTVICHTEKARETALAPAAWKLLAIEAVAADGTASVVRVQLGASEKTPKTGAYAEGELERMTERGGVAATLINALGVFIVAAVFLGARAGQSGGGEEAEAAAAAAAAAEGKGRLRARGKTTRGARGGVEERE